MSAPTPPEPRTGLPTARRQWLRLHLGLAWGLTAGLSPLIARAGEDEPLDDDEAVLFLPGIARLLDAGQVEVDIQAWVHEKGRSRVLDTALLHYLGLKASEMSATDRLRFQRRTELFHCESEQGVVLTVDFGGAGVPRVVMPASDDAGRAGMRARLTALPPTERHAEGAARWVHFRLVDTRTSARPTEGGALLVPPEGVSVVSDIDDTIRKTEVQNRHRMMLNTFARPFTPVHGMARRYRDLARQPQTCFHYLSSSPLQLLPSLRYFLNQAGFPPGSVHLRESTLVRDWIPSAAESRAHKRATLERLAQDFPQRRFLLIGDSGEADPEIYGEWARAHPQQLEAVLIRDLAGTPREDARYRDAFGGLAPHSWHLFNDGGKWPLA